MPIISTGLPIQEKLPIETRLEQTANEQKGRACGACVAWPPARAARQNRGGFAHCGSGGLIRV
jgi:hypothetical protein